MASRVMTSAPSRPWKSRITRRLRWCSVDARAVACLLDPPDWAAVSSPAPVATLAVEGASGPLVEQLVCAFAARAWAKSAYEANTYTWMRTYSNREVEVWHLYAHKCRMVWTQMEEFLHNHSILLRAHKEGYRHVPKLNRNKNSINRVIPLDVLLFWNGLRHGSRYPTAPRFGNAAVSPVADRWWYRRRPRRPKGLTGKLCDHLWPQWPPQCPMCPLQPTRNTPREALRLPQLEGVNHAGPNSASLDNGHE